LNQSRFDFLSEDFRRATKMIIAHFSSFGKSLFQKNQKNTEGRFPLPSVPVLL